MLVESLQKVWWVRTTWLHQLIRETPGAVDREIPWHMTWGFGRTTLCGTPVSPDNDQVTDESLLRDDAIRCAQCVSIRSRLSFPRFKVDDKVRIARLLDTMTDPGLVGLVGQVEEVESVTLTQHNYYVRTEHGSHYCNEQMLEPADG